MSSYPPQCQSIKSPIALLNWVTPRGRHIRAVSPAFK